MKFPKKIVKKVISILRENKRTVLALLVVLIVIETLSTRLSSDVVIFSTLLLYAIFIKLFRIKSTFTYIVCLILLIVMTISFFISGPSVRTEKAAVWFILFLGIGGVQQWRE